MTSERFLITLNKSAMQKLKQKARRRGFEDIREYVSHLIYHHLYHSGGRPKKVLFDVIADKFASHTKESRKRLNMIKRMGV